jgi:MOSC domain-containing protein YiiM
MVGRTGKMARVVRGGLVRPGDPIELLEEADADVNANDLRAGRSAT